MVIDIVLPAVLGLVLVREAGIKAYTISIQFYGASDLRVSGKA